MLRDTPRNETPKNRAEAQLVLLLPPPNRTQPLDRLSRVEPGDIGHVEELDHFHAQLDASSASVRPAFSDCAQQHRTKLHRER
jgi:hypothetical protein